MRLVVICASTPSGAFGTQDTISGLPWDEPLRDDMRMFTHVTQHTFDARKQNAVIMGRVTHMLINKVLPNRLNIVISKEAFPNTVHAVSLKNALDICHTFEIESAYVIGGVQLVHEALQHDQCEGVIWTWVTEPEFMATRHVDVALLKRYRLAQRSQDIIDRRSIRYHMAFYDREDKPALISFFTFPFPTVADFKKHEEYQYLNACETILHRGVCKPDRTGTGTLSQFGTVFRFSLRNKIIPLLTTKRVFWKGIVHELFWMLQGKTHIRWLQEKGVHIWDANGTRAFLDQRGLSHYEEGDLGPVYGFQWRHFGAEYKGHAHDYTNQGVDQIAQIIHTLRTNPHDRRMILSAWNPLALQQMALPPCHMTAQFYVAHNRLSCCLYQRSADMGLGVPFNIASYALLTHIIAHCALMEADELVHVMGDTHIYQNHVPMIREQLKRSPRPFPTINISNISVDINDMRAEDVELLNYDPHPSISMPMAV